MKRNSFSTVSSSFILGAFTFFLFSQTASCGNASYQYWNCSVPKRCGRENISFPFWISGQQQPYCGWPGFDLACRNDHPILRTLGNDYRVQEFIYKNLSLRVSNDAVSDLKDDDCWPTIANVSIDGNKFEYGPNLSYLFLFSNCSEEGVVDHRVGCGAGKKGAWAMLGDNENLTVARNRCEQVAAAPVELQGNDGVKKDYLEVMKRGFLLKWRAYNCTACEKSGGYCGSENSSTSYRFKCFCPDRPHSSSCKNINPRRSNLPLILGTVIPISFILLLGLVAILYRKKWKYVFSCIFSRSTFSHSSSKADLEGGCIYFGVPVFSHADLEEATKNFNPSKELGDGGFGTVYHGKLRDGREVAVKRMYEHNYKRVNQFMNEIEILTRLRHCNLVSLYGCTSHLSQGLLLVYEYISNGTVADHLHGDRAAEHSLTWPIRMNIAIETADALTYLHASDIIHRDVKTTNILLDNNFCVKVADFGLSRLLPTGVTHVSTAPQGTPGYVDPEYYQCYQLTDKSDVYSFGVVLIELISSMPAVDISRDRHEINLSTFAINTIQNHAFDKLIDGSLVPESDSSTKKMITLVAEVAFQCLQLEKEPRPTMDEVLEALKEIRNYKDDNSEGALDSLRSTKVLPSPEGDHAVLLRNGKGLRSPNSVTDAWLSCSSTSFSK